MNDTNTKRVPGDAQSQDGIPPLYSIFKGKVASVQPYGAFVKIPGCSRDGLVHRSQLSNTEVEKPEEMLEVGEQIYCKVISIESDGTKIALSMKVVNQTTGKDLDPALVQTSLDEKKRKSGAASRGPPKIELGAIFDTVCRKCGGKGHLAQDCFHRPGDRTYDLVLEESVSDNDQSNVDADVPSIKDKKAKKKRKKEKKKKSKREKRTSESDHHHHHHHPQTARASASDGKKRRRSSSSSSSCDGEKNSSRSDIRSRLQSSELVHSSRHSLERRRDNAVHRESRSSRRLSRSPSSSPDSSRPVSKHRRRRDEHHSGRNK